jgi:uracil-DNA glycosylase family 4
MPAMQGSATIIDAGAAANILGWWTEAGFDTAIAEQPVSWLARGATPKAVPAPVQPPAGPAPMPDTLDAFVAWRMTGEDAPEAPWGPTRIAPAGDAASGLMILTDMPDIGDMTAGQLLTGDVGRLFDRILAAIGRDRASIYLTSLALARPPGGRIDPASARRLADAARHHAMLARPRALILMGETVSRAILGTDLRDARGKQQIVHQDGVTIPVIATFHPRFLFERPAAKAEAWKDLQLLPGEDSQ